MVQRYSERAALQAKLEARGYAFKTSSNITQLRELVRRADRGMFSYEKRTVDELRQFCVQRKLQIPQNVNKAVLIDILWNADDNPVFDLFLELPPELRVRIYELLFFEVYDLEEKKTRPPPHMASGLPAQPSVTKANRLLRKEALPVFYGKVRAVIALSWRDPKPDDTAGLRFRFCPAARFFTNAPDSVIRQYKRILIQCWPYSSQQYYAPGELCRWMWEVDLIGKQNRYEMRLLPNLTEGEFQTARSASFCPVAEPLIRKILDRVVAREDGHGLLKEDGKALLRVIPEAKKALGWPSD